MVIHVDGDTTTCVLNMNSDTTLEFYACDYFILHHHFRDLKHEMGGLCQQCVIKIELRYLFDVQNQSVPGT